MYVRIYLMSKVTWFNPITFISSSEVNIVYFMSCEGQQPQMKYTFFFTSCRVNPRMGLIHFVRKLLMFCTNGHYFWLGPIFKLFKSHVNYALKRILRILGPIKFCKGPIKISKGPLKFEKFCMYLNGIWAIGPFKGPIIILGSDKPCFMGWKTCCIQSYPSIQLCSGALYQFFHEWANNIFQRLNHLNAKVWKVFWLPLIQVAYKICMPRSRQIQEVLSEGIQLWRVFF